ncbi:alpha/beta hydrolase [Novosphingobium sp. G106]|uniref:alpha/beta hydrolase n=1 Tax=Novosphingobium sp. G106 TaxID=2849500 RepID=UPI001C2CFDF4|nr:alpha/beta hydrolase [Novosphingobium sp. G106]MBV1687779.1 alpha/beta hydrolase [Novosphingobium sp. G106]
MTTKLLKLTRATGLFAALLAQAVPAAAQMPEFKRIPAPVDAAAIPLYAGQAPGSETRTEPEVWDMMSGNRVVRNVGRPTITPVLPAAGKASGAAVVIVPGGGFKFLSMDGEGWPIARWLADHGIAAFVLKYRPNETPGDEATFTQKMIADFMKAMSDPNATLPLNEPLATADTLQAIKLVREGAAKWQIDPARVGLIGFSAGAVATLEAATASPVAARPNFFGYIYGPMAAAAAVPADAPPMFVAIAMDDSLFGKQGFGIVESWRAAKRPVELHAYEKGDHGFGLGKPGTTTMMMMPEFNAWLDARGLLRPAK